MVDNQEREQRQRAEALAYARGTRAPTSLSPSAHDDPQALLHELRVHQIELELQNEELRLAQLDMDAMRERYFELYDLAPVGYCTLNEKGLIMEANLAAAKLLGLSRQGLVGQPLNRFILATEQSTFYLYRKKLIDMGSAAPCEVGMVSNDGTPFWVHLAATAALGEHAAPVLRVVLSDVTARRLAQVELRIAATAFESEQGTLVTDAQSTILRVNKAFTAITGYGAEEAMGQTPSMLSSGRHDATFFAAMWAGVAADGSWHGEIWNRHKSGEIFPQWLTITAVPDDQGRPSHYVANYIDISLRKAAEEEITKLAFYDLLTGLPNRRLLMDRLEQALASGERHGRQGVLMFVDLDNFKTINDTLGHSQGDLLLTQVASRLAACVREGDTVARLGGDEFVVMLLDLNNNASAAAIQAEAVGKQIQQALNKPYQLGKQSVRSTASTGVTLFTDHLTGMEELLKQADLAMYQAKEAGRNCVRFFEPQMQAAVSARAELEVALRVAVDEGQFVLHYQPQVSVNAQITDVEALLRWLHPERGLIAPAEFISLAEDTGLILPLGQWVLETACAQLVLWAKLPGMAHLNMAVNVSARQFHQKDFVEQVLSALASTGANPQRLKLELTEGLLVQELEAVIAKMNTLKLQGIGFSLDDFGTGYSSLSYLKRLPLDQLKIDQSFVRDLLTDPNDAAIARAVISLGHSLGLQVIAEGVETTEQCEALATMGCDAYQGYCFGRPASAASLETSMANSASSPRK